MPILVLPHPVIYTCEEYCYYDYVQTLKHYIYIYVCVCVCVSVRKFNHACPPAFMYASYQRVFNNSMQEFISFVK